MIKYVPWGRCGAGKRRRDGIAKIKIRRTGSCHDGNLGAEATYNSKTF
jgi:hypothetical protein